MTYKNLYDFFLIFYAPMAFFPIFAKKVLEMEVNLTKERITELITQKGITKAEFAKRLGYERNNLDAYLSAKKKDINLVIKMAEALDLNLYDLLGLDEPGAKDVYGCLYVKGMPVLVNSKADIERVLNSIE